MKSKHLKIIIPIFAVLFFVSFSQAADTIRIGWTADMPGIGATFYESQKNAIELFIEEKNAAGGVLGKKLELVIRDSKLKPDVGATVAREFNVPFHGGVLVNHVFPNSPSGLAGLQRGDIMFRIDGRRVKNQDMLWSYLATKKNG